ncbi:MAG TPA: zf-HC2 domain-containing protein [Pyrinomonadaceae bacterium]|nr:zf-HC2 domain-containing protein [Pyrinomonadaceae bacterium]
MKCEVCSELLEEYLDSELAPQDREQVDAHLFACIECSESFAALTAEQEIFARYDREIEVPPFLWTRIAAHTNTPKRRWFAGLVGRRSLAGAIAVLLVAVAIGALYLFSKPKPPTPTIASTPPTAPSPIPLPKPVESAAPKREVVASKPKPRPRVKLPVVADQSDVLSSELAYLDMDEQDTALHIEQSKILLRSIKNVQISDTDDEIDVTYDKALSRRLLNENVVLRRDAEMKAKFPTKTLLADLEPFLIDIANLPDRARPQDVREIKERVQKTEIVAALLDYQDRGANNR